MMLHENEGATWTDVSATLAELWAMYAELKCGFVRELEGVRVPNGNLAVLLGFGAPLFKLNPARSLPTWLGEAYCFAPYKKAGPVCTDIELDNESGIRYTDVGRNRGDAAVAVQFTADTPLAVERAVVETAKLLDRAAAPLRIDGVFPGSQRDDGRSWIGFYDGLSNLTQDERPLAIVVGEQDIPEDTREDAWTLGGTYLGFLRLRIDLLVWNRLSRADQERSVGRDKLDGCPLWFDTGGQKHPQDGCPAPGKDITAWDNPFRDPEQQTDPIAKLSHIQRVRHVRCFGAANPQSLRVFRQSYEFLEPCLEGPGFRVGLNFVSFQNMPMRLTRILTDPCWLGQTNFGGQSNNSALSALLSADAAGCFVVPPHVVGERYPGAEVLDP
jgi:deferrochelatase/peroxidase EfeB